jgi:hypothetical protein
MSDEFAPDKHRLHALEPLPTLHRDRRRACASACSGHLRTRPVCRARTMITRLYRSKCASRSP